MSFWGDALVDELLTATRASRVTLRLAEPERVFPVVAEALAEGVLSMRGELSPAARQAPTFRYLEERRAILVQDDCERSEHAPPSELRARYGVRAQMLAPIVRAGELAGTISVHDTATPRTWTQPEVAALERAARHAELALAGAA